MDVRIRTTRKLKVTEVEISDEERELLAQLANDSRYEALLNLMERCCIEIETAHFNTSVNNPEEILGGHALAKACWLFFTYIQKRVQNAVLSRAADQEEMQAPPTLEEYLQGVE